MLDRLTKLREERANSDKGFTLIELLVVVVIIGILIAIAIPLYLNYTKGASDKSTASDVRGAVSAIEQCNSDNGVYPTALGARTPAPPAAGQYALTSTPTCTQVIKVSSGTTLSYTPVTTAGAVVSYTVHGTNSKGATKYYCYNSANGGSVSTVASMTATC